MVRILKADILDLKYRLTKRESSTGHESQEVGKPGKAQQPHRPPANCKGKKEFHFQDSGVTFKQ